MTQNLYGEDLIMKNIIEKIKKQTPNIIIIFLYLQPFLEILHTLLEKSPLLVYLTGIIRFLFMGFMILYLIIEKYENKKIILPYTLLLIITMLSHIIYMYYIDPLNILINIRTTLSTYYFIYLLISFYVIYKNTNFNKKHLEIIYIIYLLLTFIPNILNIGFKSYWHSKVGSSGFFKSANVLSSILLLLLIVVIPKLKKEPLPFKIILSLITIYVFLSIGTKTPVIGLILSLITYLLFYIYKIIKEKNKKQILITSITILLITVLSIIVVPSSSFYENIKIHYTYLKENNKTSKFELLDNLVFSERLTFAKNTHKIYKSSSLPQKILGLGYIENGREKVIEIDYLDIFYKEGILAFILYFIPIIYIITKYIKNFKPNFININNLLTLILILLIALFQGHIFITPVISIFIALILIINSKKEVDS